MSQQDDFAANNREPMTDRTADHASNLNPQVKRVDAMPPHPSGDRTEAGPASAVRRSHDIAGTIGPSGVAGPSGAAGPSGVAGPSEVAVSKPASGVTGRAPTHLSREQILDATAACLAELGYDGTTIRRIAKRLNCAVGSIYRYFDDKRALLAAVVQRRFEPVIERIEQGAPIDSVADFYALIAGEQSELYRLMFWLASVGKDQQANTVPPAIRGIIDGWTQQIGDARVAESYWSQLHGAIMLGRRVDDVPVPTAKG